MTAERSRRVDKSAMSGAISTVSTWRGALRLPLGPLIVALSITPTWGKPAVHITSTAFADQSPIPALYTCEGRDISPPLQWSGLPEGTRSLALIVDDPDAPDPAAPRVTWVHWVVYNLPPTVAGLPEQTAAGRLPQGAREGLNDWKRTGYGGPCPPIGRHRYFHRLYALDIVLPDLGAATRNDLDRAMRGHILAEAVLMGTYQKQGKSGR